jgi:type I restriction-modification system DNA methylase subunit
MLFSGRIVALYQGAIESWWRKFSMAIKKSELYSSLWKSCDELRGGMDASQYKDYVLVLLFVKYVSDKYAGQSNALIEVPEGGSFAGMVALKGDKEIGDKITLDAKIQQTKKDGWRGNRIKEREVRFAIHDVLPDLYLSSPLD